MATFSARVSLVDAGMLRLLFPIYACSLFFLLFSSIRLQLMAAVELQSILIKSGFI